MMKQSKTKKWSLDVSNDLGLFLKEQRLRQGLSQGELAQLLHYDSPQYISDWERGVSSPPMKKLQRLAKILELKTDPIFELMVNFSKDRLLADMFSSYLKICKKT